MYSNLQLAICISALVGAVWASPFELDVRGKKMSSVGQEERAGGRMSHAQGKMYEK